jgi:hypothetical protein
MILPSLPTASSSAPNVVGSAGPDVPSARVETIVSVPLESALAASA